MRVAMGALIDGDGYGATYPFCKAPFSPDFFLSSSLASSINLAGAGRAQMAADCCCWRLFISEDRRRQENAYPPTLHHPAHFPPPFRQTTVYVRCLNRRVGVRMTTNHVMRQSTPDIKSPRVNVLFFNLGEVNAALVLKFVLPLCIFITVFVFSYLEHA